MSVRDDAACRARSEAHANWARRLIAMIIWGASVYGLAEFALHRAEVQQRLMAEAAAP